MPELKKPDCACFQDPELAKQKEQLVEGMARGLQISLNQSAAAMGFCAETAPYIAGTVMHLVIFWVAYSLRGDGQPPTDQQVAEAERLVIEVSRARLEGAGTSMFGDVPVQSRATH